MIRMTRIYLSILFCIPFANVSLIGRHKIGDEGLPYLGHCSTLMAFEQGVIFAVPCLLLHRTSVFIVSSEGPFKIICSLSFRLVY